jgi:hypothetical protein
LNKSLKSWFGQVTTAHGIMVLAPTLLSVLSGTLKWSSATPLLVAGAVGLAWPENTALQASAQSAAADLANVAAALTAKSGTKPGV